MKNMIGFIFSLLCFWNKKPKILYICDRRACEKCNPECFHTNNVNHAENFKLVFDDFVEGRF